MARFRYRMQSVLDVKLKLEEQARQGFAGAKLKLDKEQEALSALENRKKEYEAEAVRLRLEILDFLAISTNQTAIARMEELIEDQKVRVRDAEDALEEARKALTQVMMERKAQEILKEKAFEEFRQELNRAESKEVDELTSYVYGRNARSAGQ